MMQDLSVGIFQIDSIWNDPSANLILLEKQLSGIEQTPDIVVLPEMWTTGFVMNPDPRINEGVAGRLASIAARHNVILLGSIAVYIDGAFRNRAIVVSGEGIVSSYDKQYLFSPAGEHKVYKEGTKCQMLRLHEWNTKLQICYDLRFPESVRNEQQPDIIVYMANWPAPRIMQWKQLLIARAIENQCVVVGCNRRGTDHNGWVFPGESMVINYDGTTLLQLDADTEYSVCSLSKASMLAYRQKLPFYLDKKPFT